MKILELASSSYCIEALEKNGKAGILLHSSTVPQMSVYQKHLGVICLNNRFLGPA